MRDGKNQKIAIATAATMIAIVGIWIASLPKTLQKQNTAPGKLETSTNAAWGEFQAKLEDIRGQLQKIPSSSASANAALPPTLVQNLQIKIQGNASSSKK